MVRSLWIVVQSNGEVGAVWLKMSWFALERVGRSRAILGCIGKVVWKNSLDKAAHQSRTNAITSHQESLEIVWHPRLHALLGHILESPECGALNCRLRQWPLQVAEAA